MKQTILSMIATAITLQNASAFLPASTSNARRCNSEIFAEQSDRREVLGNFAQVITGAVAGAGIVGGVSSTSPVLLSGLSNPAGGNFRGKFKGQSFKPGKGMRNHEDELLAGLSNPAGGNFRGKFKGQSFKPGKGMRNHEDELLAGLSNPAGGNFRGKFKGQSFKPGKGMRNHEDELLAGLSNPAGGNFRGKFKGQSFKPGKGMRSRDSFDELC